MPNNAWSPTADIPAPMWGGNAYTGQTSQTVNASGSSSWGPGSVTNFGGVGGDGLTPGQQDPIPGSSQNGQVPWWLNPRLLNRNIAELEATYKQAGGTTGKPAKRIGTDPTTGKGLYDAPQKSAFDVSDTVASLQNLVDTNYGMSMQNADAAAREAQARARQQGGEVNTSLVRGQAAYTGQQQKFQGEAQLGQYADQARQAEFGARASLAESIARLRSQYAQQLAAYSQGRDAQQLGREEFYQSLGGQNSQFQANLELQKQQLAQQGDLTRQQLAKQRSGAGGIGLGGAVGFPTFFSSSGISPTYAGFDVNRSDAMTDYLKYMKELEGI